MLTISPALNGFLKGLMLMIVLGVSAFLSNAANLEGVVPAILIPLVVATASSIESSIKASTGKGLFGAARVSH